MRYGIAFSGKDCRRGEPLGGEIVTIHTEDDLDLDRIAESGQCFRWEKTGAQAYRVIAGKTCLYIAALGDGRFELDCTEEEYRDRWRGYLDLAENYRGIRQRIDKGLDPFLWEAAKAEQGIRILRQDPWEVLITFLISQRKSIPAIRRAVELLCARYGEDAGSAAGIRLFPAPEALLSAGPEGLKACGIGYRVPYLLDAARKTVSGELDPAALEKLSDEELFSRLLSVFGIGKKVADCVMLYGYGRVGRAPEDVWVKRIREQRFAGADLFPVWNAAGFPAGILQQYLFSHAVHHRAAYRKNAGT